MSVRICASVTATSLQDMRRMIRQSTKDGADLIEVRLDYLQGSYNLRDIRKLSDLPLIATNRSIREGGLFKGTDEERINLLFSAADAGFDFIDVELSTEKSGEVIENFRGRGVETVVSTHIFDSTPDKKKLKAILREEKNVKADVCKIVMTADKFEDNLTCLGFVDATSKNVNLVCFCLGDIGITSRLLSPLLGGVFNLCFSGEGERSSFWAAYCR